MLEKNLTRLTPPARSDTLAFRVRRFPLTVHLPPRIERIVEEAVRSGEYNAAEEVLSEAVAVWQSRHTAAKPAGDDRQAAVERLKNFGKTHHLSLGGITIRQLRDEAHP